MVPEELRSLRIVQNGVGQVAETTGDVAVASAPLPDDFCSEVFRTKNGIEEYLQVIASSPIAMQIRAAGRL